MLDRPPITQTTRLVDRTVRVFGLSINKYVLHFNCISTQVLSISLEVLLDPLFRLSFLPLLCISTLLLVDQFCCLLQVGLIVLPTRTNRNAAQVTQLWIPTLRRRSWQLHLPAFPWKIIVNSQNRNGFASIGFWPLNGLQIVISKRTVEEQEGIPWTRVQCRIGRRSDWNW